MSNIITTFKISGLHCESCKKISEKRIQKIEGVLGAITSLETHSVAITSDRSIAKNEVIEALKGTDYQII